ncbi:TAXI family TRAP transporter solute-binding subunit [Dactylosporangium vinaceum]|uniref:TAXI family TRAP transporter solute-binding subunit n=1 Tax=Dactylosporangium vinaceum TaxID=53362 RepID=A0ABV5MHL8_9ACTN|nr:TAXI family TRAP transporter solute-binding subunit [Dactylosporangium vinaceum]UAB94749.1 TAXI family TRAP transporter solute-binding subunit [Dactylosporangium vinaceum]
MRRRTLLALPALAVVAGCDPDGAEAAGELRIATGSPGAVYYRYGSAIAELCKKYLPNVHASVLTTAASEINVRNVLDDVADVAFTQADVTDSHEKAQPRQLAALARLYDDHIHVVVAAQGPIAQLHDLQGRRVSIGGVGSGTAITARRVLSVSGIEVHEAQYGLDDSVRGLRNGDVEAFFFSGGLPVSAIADLAREFPIRLLNLADPVKALRSQWGDYYAERVVPASTYTGITATVAIGIANYLVVRMTMSEPLAYGVTRLLFEGRDELAKAHQAAARLNIRSAISTPPLALHPGAIRYYRAQKA